MNIVFLGIGTNLGNRGNNLKEAIARIEEHIGPVLKSSSVYETEPWGFQSGDEFLNMVVKVETKLIPAGLLERILMIESLLGRVKGEKQYSSRVIDIDILLYEGMVIDEKSLKIPHPLMHKRKFVLVPLCEIEPELVHPVLNQSIAFLLKTCKDKSKVLPHNNPLSAKL
ncbi:MAG: 2-amino-4-hydroxy-6-hydroxymethyldihydropteridine diphosphokinase [Bacteroidales bacterium]|nr:2-amino-4-hydroxy-6-hydroxymethyldihydropteridine diphosphokinase [Bacteroidales bacterium]MDP3002060.1 2-amino-4-hydroxy-6-hydroxymethyldihydropteridine diphosphokinase [Bacteroidales bacterium]